MDTKTFDLRTVLTATTDRLLTKRDEDGGNGIGHLYDILGWMTNDSPYIHQLPRFSEECKPWLLRWFPELGPASVSMHKLDEWIAKSQDGPETGIIYWLAELKLLVPGLKDEYEIPRIPQDDHTQKDGYDELVEMQGTDENIVLIELPGKEPSS